MYSSLVHFGVYDETAALAGSLTDEPCEPQQLTEGVRIVVNSNVIAFPHPVGINGDQSDGLRHQATYCRSDSRRRCGSNYGSYRIRH